MGTRHLAHNVLKRARKMKLDEEENDLARWGR
jgi:hypothetical protein